MWRRVYLGLVLVRLYFALSPSYLHPDEHFQGPEVIAAKIFGHHAHKTWEFDPNNPIRSVFPLWLVYGWPLTALGWITKDVLWPHVPPTVVFYALRVLMFLINFVLQDWALYELITVPRQRRVAILLVSSSYVTWTWQSHTFSNAIESTVVLWCLAIMKRIREDQSKHQLFACSILAFLAVFGTFNRITFPAFMTPAVGLLPFFRQKPLSLLVTIVVAVVTVLLVVAVDTEWYTAGSVTLATLPQRAVLTPLNNLAYNLDPSNLAQHGLHPRYQHILINLPQLLGPALLLLYRPRLEAHFWSALSGIAVLSAFKHQEARFLLPAVPLLLASTTLPSRARQAWIAAWIIFNAVLGILMGTYHQGGVVPAQLFISGTTDITQALWWKTLSPPNYLLGQRVSQVSTVDLMGMSGHDMIEHIHKHVECDSTDSVLVAPRSAVFLDSLSGLSLTPLHTYKHHLNLDDLDIPEEGFLPTIRRVVGRRGLVVHRINRPCG